MIEGFKVLKICWGFMECLAFSGLLFGWSSLLYILKDEGLFLDECGQYSASTHASYNSTGSVSFSLGNYSGVCFIGFNKTQSVPKFESLPKFDENCVDRRNSLALVFTLASSVYCVNSVWIGFVNKRFGTRVTRHIALFLFVTGSIFITITTNGLPWFIVPGLCFLSGGGLAYMITNIQQAHLYPKLSSTICGIFNGAFDASSGVMLMIKFAYESGLSRQISFIILTFSNFATLISTLLFLPTSFVNETDEEKEKRKSKKCLCSCSIQELKKYIICPVYISQLAWNCVLQARFFFFIGSMNEMFEDTMPEDQVSTFIDYASYTLMSGILFSPFAGFIYDVQSRLFKGVSSPQNRTLRSAVIPMAVTTALSLTLSGLLFLEGVDKCYCIMVTFLLFRSFLSTVNMAFLTAFYPAEYFGILYGIMTFIAGAVGVTQYPLVLWSRASGIEEVNAFLVLVVALTFLHPLHLWLRSFLPDVKSQTEEQLEKLNIQENDMVSNINGLPQEVQT